MDAIAEAEQILAKTPEVKDTFAVCGFSFGAAPPSIFGLGVYGGFEYQLLDLAFIPVLYVVVKSIGRKPE